MLNEILFFQSGTFYGGGIGSLLSSWEQAGFFSYVVPFLLIFALVFGILTKVRIFDNKSINGIIAFAVGLLALQFNFVSIFFSELFPRVGVGLAIILALLILVSLFFDPNNKFTNYGLLFAGVIIFLVVLIQTYGSLGSLSFLYSLQYNWATILGVIIFIVIIGVVVGGGNPRQTPPQYPILWGAPGRP